MRLWHLGTTSASSSRRAPSARPTPTFIVAFHKKYIEAHPRHGGTRPGNWTDLQAYTPDVRRGLTEWQRTM
ncbi:MAG: hypothetical protein IPI43_13495, partial [Sandaracinaceae bacterium]|nr:hypothetical protein [Sandaracinaceae bacterium]